MLVPQMLNETARRFPEKEAVVYGGNRTSYSSLKHQSVLLATGLSSLDIGAGQYVVLLLDNIPEFVSGFFALASIGAMSVPLDPKARDRELSIYLRTFQPLAIITQAKYADRIERLSKTLNLDITVITTDGPQTTA